MLPERLPTQLSRLKSWLYDFVSPLGTNVMSRVVLRSHGSYPA